LATYNKIDDETALTRFTALLNNNAKKQTDISRIFGKINKKDENKAREKSETYLESIYFK
jgi:hypothetical protein